MYFNEYFEIWLYSSAGVALSWVTVCWHPSICILCSKIHKIWICLNSQAMVDSMVSWAAVMQQESMKIHFLSWTLQSLEQRNLSFALLKGNDYLPQYSDYMRWSNGGRWRHGAYSHNERGADSASCGISHMWNFPHVAELPEPAEGPKSLNSSQCLDSTWTVFLPRKGGDA